MLRYSRKPAKCPVCGSDKIASIQYGYPAFSPELQADMAAGRVVLGGCCITGDDPAWKCIDCEAMMFRKKKE